VKRTIAIITDDPGWHGARLREVFSERGFESRYIPLQECRLDLAASCPVTLPGISSVGLHGVFVRGVPAGTLQEVVFYLDVLHALRELGVLVYNDARAIERSVDKAMTSFLLVKAGIATPSTWVLPNIEQARALVMRETALGRQLVYKPLFGSQGEGLLRISRVDDLPSPEQCCGIYYLQHYVDTGEGQWHDWRVLVVAGRAVLAMRRSGVNWINNVAQGGRCEAAELDEPLRRLAEQAARVLDIHYAGVDIIRDASGRYQVLEVNSVPAWKGLQTTTQISVAHLLADDFLARCAEYDPIVELVV
jgi:tetrahydromethanopterin:alpha-L-glutamate ligase